MLIVSVSSTPDTIRVSRTDVVNMYLITYKHWGNTAFPLGNKVNTKKHEADSRNPDIALCGEGHEDRVHEAATRIQRMLPDAQHAGGDDATLQTCAYADFLRGPRTHAEMAYFDVGVGERGAAGSAIDQRVWAVSPCALAA